MKQITKEAILKIVRDEGVQVAFTKKVEHTFCVRCVNLDMCHIKLQKAAMKIRGQLGLNSFIDYLIKHAKGKSLIDFYIQEHINQLFTNN